MMIRFFILIAFLISPIFGCQTIFPENYREPVPSNTDILKTTLAALNVENPVQDLDANIKNNDLRFICVCGFACYTPAVDSNDSALTRKYGSRCLEGTTDMIESREHGQLIESARKYAERYNTELLKWLKLKSDP